MSKREKVLEELLSNPREMSWTAVVSLLRSRGWTCEPMRGGGSHWKFTTPTGESRMAKRYGADRIVRLDLNKIRELIERGAG
jgi:hypothetical protein